MNHCTNSVLKNLFILSFLFTYVVLCGQQPTAPPWLEYVHIDESGYSKDSIDSIVETFENSEGASLMVVHQGRILLALGDNTRRFMTHSIRKSFLSALYGIEIDKRNIDLNATLKTLKIDDINPLTSTEKTATIQHLLSARSGVYLPSAYSPQGMEKNLPQRGSKVPGEHWYYNNWDFNTLCTIYEQETGQSIFTAFKKEIADPIGMEDFRVTDGHYRVESEKSQHPAYLFNMSARDMARFGLLYLNKGVWLGNQVVPQDWVEHSTACISSDLGRFGNRGCYGYLWWVSEEIQDHPMFYASGSGGHRIFVLPQDDLVIVHRVNTYEGKNVNQQKVMDLIASIINAKTDTTHPEPKLKPYEPLRNIPSTTVQLSDDALHEYLGKYKHPFLGYFEIKKGEEGTLLASNVGTFNLHATDHNHFFPEDLETMIEMAPTPDESKKRSIEPVFGPGRSLKKVIFYF